MIEAFVSMFLKNLKMIDVFIIGFLNSLKKKIYPEIAKAKIEKVEAWIDADNPDELLTFLEHYPDIKIPHVLNSDTTMWISPLHYAVIKESLGVCKALYQGGEFPVDEIKEAQCQISYTEMTTSDYKEFDLVRTKTGHVFFKEELERWLLVCEKHPSSQEILPKELIEMIPLHATPLEYALMFEKREVCEYFLSFEQSPQTKLHLLELAIMFDKPEMVKWLLEKLDKDVLSRHGYTPLMMAVFFDNRPILRDIIEKQLWDINAIRAQDGMSALKYAIKKEKQEMLDILIAKGANWIGDPGYDNKIPFQMVVEDGSIEFFQSFFETLRTNNQVVTNIPDPVLNVLWGRVMQAVGIGYPSFLPVIHQVLPPVFVENRGVYTTFQTRVDERGEEQRIEHRYKIWEYMLIKGRADWLKDFVFANNSIELDLSERGGRALFELAMLEGTVDVAFVMVEFLQRHPKITFSDNSKQLFLKGIRKAILMGRLDYVRAAYELPVASPLGFMIEDAELDSPSLLVCAVISNSIEILDFLLEQGADINDLQPGGINALAWAIFKNKEMIIPLLKRQADVKIIMQNNRSVLHFLAISPLVDAEYFQEILALRPEIAGLRNHRDVDGRTPLMHAAQSTRENLIPVLLDIDQDSINAQDNKGESALTLAAFSGTVGQMRLLLEAGASIEQERFDGWNVLSLLANWDKEIEKIELVLGHEDILTVLNKLNNIGRTPLMTAIAYNRVGNVQALLNTEGIDVGVIGQNGYTALHMAAMNESSDCLALLLAHKDIKKCFEVRDKIHDRTPLQNAVEMKLVENVRLLLEKGANAQEQATMRLAIVSKNLDTMALLLSYGYDWNSFIQLNQEFGKPEYLDQVKQSQYFDEDKVFAVERTQPVRADDLNANVMAVYPGEEGENHQSQQRGLGL